MAGNGDAAIRDAVQEALSPVPCRMETNGKPQTASALQRERHQKSHDRQTQRTPPVLSGIDEEMNASEQGSEERSGRPEAKAARQREQRVSTEGKTLGHADQHEHRGPDDR